MAGTLLVTLLPLAGTEDCMLLMQSWIGSLGSVLFDECWPLCLSITCVQHCPRHAPSRCLQPLSGTLTYSVAACGCLCMRSTQSLHCCPLFSCRRLQCSHFLLLPGPTNYKSLRQCQASAGMCGGSTTTSAWPTKLIHTFRARNQIWQDAAAPILISWALLWNFRFVLTHVRRNQDGCVAMTCDAYPLAWSGVSL